MAAGRARVLVVLVFHSFDYLRADGLNGSGSIVNADVQHSDDASDDRSDDRSDDVTGLDGDGGMDADACLGGMVFRSKFRELLGGGRKD